LKTASAGSFSRPWIRSRTRFKASFCRDTASGAGEAVETGVGAWLEITRSEAEARALAHGESGLLMRAAAVCTGPATLVLRAVGWTEVAAICFLLGAVLSRYGWLHAGRASARDPEETLAAQRGPR